MEIVQATCADVDGLARLLWLDTRQEEPDVARLLEFAAELAHWWDAHKDSHFVFIGRDHSQRVAGMAWVAMVSRVARPGAVNRFSADIQSVFVLPEHRSHGLGSALIDAAARHARQLGALRVSVHSGRRAIPVYERLGFASSRQLLQRLGE